MTKYNSPFSTDYRSPIYIDSKDPRAQKDKLGKNVARHGRKIKIVENKESIQLEKYVSSANFVGVSEYYSTIATYSLDGFLWEATTIPEDSPYNTAWYAVTYGNGKFIATGYGIYFAVSTNGKTWELQVKPNIASQYNTGASIDYQGNKFLLWNTESAAIAVSNNGVTWTIGSLPSEEDWWWSEIKYGNGVFVATGGYNGYSAYSTDALNWSLSTMPYLDTHEYLTFTNGIFLCANSNSFTNFPKAAISSDGINWSTVILPYGSNFTSIVSGAGIFLCFTRPTDAESYLYSIDAVTWTIMNRPLSAGGWWYASAYGSGLFVVLESNTDYPRNSAYTSPDGINWTQSTLPTNFIWGRVAART